jgi:dienelactone hydrolase
MNPTTVLPPYTGPKKDVMHSVESISRDLGSIRVNIFRPAPGEKRAAVFFLHGAFGLIPSYLPFIYPLVRNGYLVFAPNYFSPTGTSLARMEASRENFFPWLGTAIDAFGNLRSRNEIDCSRIATAGTSLGASLALALGAQLPGVRAVVEFFGHVPKICLVSSMPPTFIVHGGSDRHVPVRTAVRLAVVLKERNVPCELNVYPYERHVLRPRFFREAMKRATEFLRTHV